MSRIIYKLLIACCLLIIGFLVWFFIVVITTSEGRVTRVETVQESVPTMEEQEDRPEVEAEGIESIEEEPEQGQELELEPMENEGRPTRTNFLAEDGLHFHSQEAYYSIYFFDHGIWYYNGESRQMPAASVIKVYIMRYAYSLIETGEISLDYLIAGQSVEQLIRGMIQWSDNDATNALIDYFGMESINQYLWEQGYTDTVLQRRMLDTQARAMGLDNYTSTRDAMEFLKRLYSYQFVFPYNEMLEIMSGQGINTKIPLFLPAGTPVANKTGELDDVENDIGIVFAEGSAFAIVVLSSGVHNTESMRHGIGQLALEAFEYVLSLTLGQE